MLTAFQQQRCHHHPARRGHRPLPVVRVSYFLPRVHHGNTTSASCAPSCLKKQAAQAEPSAAGATRQWLRVGARALWRADDRLGFSFYVVGARPLPAHAPRNSTEATVVGRARWRD